MYGLQEIIEMNERWTGRAKKAQVKRWFDETLPLLIERRRLLRTCKDALGLIKKLEYYGACRFEKCDRDVVDRLTSTIKTIERKEDA